MAEKINPTFHNVTVTGNLLDEDGNAIDVTATAGVTAGTVTASKVTIVDSNKDISGYRNIGATGTATVGAVTGADAALNITGSAGSSGAGGTVPIAGGAGDTDSAGGAAGITGGAGNGTGDGGAVNSTGGAGGATGAGGAASVTGGAGGSTSGAGGATTVAGGAAATDGSGGAASLSGGAGAGANNGGAVTVAGGASGAGATGNGGAVNVNGGAAASTNGDGGALAFGAGAGTGTGTGGAASLTGGASAGAGGTAGAATVDAGAATGGTGAGVNVGTTNAASVAIGNASAAVTIDGSSIEVNSLPVHDTGLGQTLRLPITQGFDNDYAPCNAAAATEPDVQLAGTIGTDLYALTEAIQNGTKYGQINLECVLPAHYKAGTDLTLTVNVERVVSGGTTLTTNIDAEAYLMADAGDFGSDICATAEQAFTETDGTDYTFTITGTTLNPNDRLVLRLKGSATEAGNSGTVAVRINSAHLS